MDVFTNYYRLHNDPSIKRRNTFNYILSSIDLIGILLTFQTAYIINYWEQGGLFFSERNLTILFISVLPFWLLILYLIRSTGIPTKRYKVLSILYFQSSTAIFILLTLIYFFFRLHPVKGYVLPEIPFFGYLYLFLGRILIYKILNRFGDKDHNLVIAIIIADDSSVPFIDNLLLNKRLGYKPVVMFTESADVKSKYENISIILPEKFTGIIGDLIEVDFVDEVLYLKNKADSNEIREIITTCEDLGVTFRLRDPKPSASLSSAVKTNMADGKFLSFINIPNNTYAIAIRKTLDINIALLMIVVLSPVFLIIGLIIKLTSRGPVISKISKSGWRGRQIKVYRFRSMYLNADKRSYYVNPESNGAISEYEVDPRYTAIGRFLVKSGLDQLPQLFNVLKGEISIVGPQHPLESEDIKSLNRKYS